jgi:tetratricopeptide (TPR) repeat protein
MLAQDPNNQLAQYGLAMELTNLNQLSDAHAAFERLLVINPNYAAGYYHAGKAFEKDGRLEDARQIWEKGLDVTQRNGDAHTASEIQAALDLLGL